MRISRRVLCLPLLAVFLIACDEDWDFGGDGHYRKDFHFSYTLPAGASVEMDNLNGSIDITGWEKNTIDIDGTKFANSETRLDEIKIDIQQSANSINIRTIPPIDRHGNAGARYVIRVPRRVELSSIRSSNGSIHVDSIEGAAHLRTSNGSVRAEHIQGPLDIETSNGSVEVASITGDAILHSSNGTIRAEVERGGFQARTSNSSISARLLQPADKPVRLESSNGRIELEMDAMREVRASTSNSSITVRLPGNAGAKVSAHTSNASIESDFDVSVHGMISKHSIEGNIGSGGPLLDLTTSNGGIRLLRF